MMGITQVQASVFGDRETREYEFVVDTGSTYLALPPEEIEALGLRRANGTVRLMGASQTKNIVNYLMLILPVHKNKRMTTVKEE